MNQSQKFYKDYIIAFLLLIGMNFLLPRLLPGDPVQVLIGEQALYEVTPEAKLELEKEFGLDKPIYFQFVKYIGKIVMFKFGYSYYYKTEVLDLVLGHLGWTFILVFSGMLLSFVLGYLTGIESGYNHRKKVDRFFLCTMMIISGFPQFFIGMLLLIVFTVKLGWFPPGGCESPCSDFAGVEKIKDIVIHMILPVATIVIYSVSNIYLLTRNTAISVRTKKYMEISRAKGLRESVRKHRYLGKNSFVPLLTMFAMIMGRMFVGILIVEVVFSYPGLGTLIYESIKVRDYPVLQACFLIISFMVLVFNGAAEWYGQKYSERR